MHFLGSAALPNSIVSRKSLFPLLGPVGTLIRIPKCSIVKEADYHCFENRKLAVVAAAAALVQQKRRYVVSIFSRTKGNSMQVLLRAIRKLRGNIMEPSPHIQKQ